MADVRLKVVQRKSTDQANISYCPMTLHLMNLQSIGGRFFDSALFNQRGDLQLRAYYHCKPTPISLIAIIKM